MRPTQLNNQKPAKVMEEMDTSPPDYLPYNIYKNLQPLQKPVEDVQIQPVSEGELAKPRDPMMRPKKRHSKLKLTGEVDLGGEQFRMRNERRKRKKKRPMETSTKANTEVFSVDSTLRQRDEFDLNEIATEHSVEFVTSTHRPTLRLEFETSENPLEERTTKTTTSTASSDNKKKLQEKAQRRQRLIEKLKQLTPEERQAFLLMKQQRAEAKKKGLTFGHWFRAIHWGHFCAKSISGEWISHSIFSLHKYIVEGV